MEVSAKLPKGTTVQFTSEWLARLSPAEAQRFISRQGIIDGYRGQIGTQVPEPIVLFPKVGRRVEVKLFEVPWANLELSPTA
ncbi:hypothetical protein [Pseudomonas mosselii]|uniref:hypothetical protein n=1 Tax=Pseudomonas mosselii TaxID=78327 RepID=UPI0021DB4C8F|nr:hypothetical protein [Pseudomonas mosselii]MCU9527513.1 hypothetical protein [Pseudomonas mosselii]MCU9534826.1 hypothetical protein [Pseudomonas mosselii]MCU9542760.1 hypothetical protein [Pseudomonas mosselii]MCU9546666.1 hypothetical protein [Pseudomonas mosselii]